MLLVVAYRLERDREERHHTTLVKSVASSLRNYLFLTYSTDSGKRNTDAKFVVYSTFVRSRNKKQKSNEMYIKFNWPRRNVAKVVLEFRRAMKG